MLKDLKYTLSTFNQIRKEDPKEFYGSIIFGSLLFVLLFIGLWVAQGYEKEFGHSFAY